jgi:hypothetical protein
MSPSGKDRLTVIVDDTDDEAVVREKKEKVLAEHIASHPEDAGCTIADFKWIVKVILRSFAGWQPDFSRPN